MDILAIVAVICIVGAVLIAGFGQRGWGWFLFIGFLLIMNMINRGICI